MPRTVKAAFCKSVVTPGSAQYEFLPALFTIFCKLKYIHFKFLIIPLAVDKPINLKKYKKQIG